MKRIFLRKFPESAERGGYAIWNGFLLSAGSFFGYMIDEEKGNKEFPIIMQSMHSIIPYEREGERHCIIWYCTNEKRCQWKPMQITMGTKSRKEKWEIYVEWVSGKMEEPIGFESFLKTKLGITMDDYNRYCENNTKFEDQNLADLVEYKFETYCEGKVFRRIIKPSDKWFYVGHYETMKIPGMLEGSYYADGFTCGELTDPNPKASDHISYITEDVIFNGDVTLLDYNGEVTLLEEN